MTHILLVAADLLREAASRKWFLALGIGITLVLGTLGLTLKMDVVDGALAATRLFGRAFAHSDIKSVDVALRPVFRASAYLVFYGGIAFGIVACADFGPSLLSPGRIEHLLSLPVRRFELLAGTFLGVLVLALCGALYGAGGLAVILGFKTGVWTARPVLAALLACLSFASLYACMISAAVFVRSAALSAAVGMTLFIGGIVAGYRTQLAPMFDAGIGREAFKAVTLFLPRLSALADAGADLASSAPLETPVLGSLLAGIALFGAASLLVGAWHFEQRDF